MTLHASGEELRQALNVRQLGEEGERTVVLAHGFGCTQSLWDAVLPTLLDCAFEGRGAHIILFDWPGATSSQLKPPPLNFCHAFSQILLSLLEELRVSSCIFVGHSMSATIGCIAALQQPSLFQKLIFVGASPRYLNSEDYYGGFEQEDLDHLYNAMETDFRGWATAFARIAVGDNNPEKAIEKFTATLSNMQADVALEMAKEIFTGDFRAVIEEFCVKLAGNDVKVAVLQMHKDVVVPLSVSDYFKLLFGNKAVVEILPTEGHFPQLSAPDLFAAALLKHLN